MIRENNPAIDVEDLMRRVRAEAARLRASGAIEERRLDSRDSEDLRLAKAIDRHHNVSKLLVSTEQLNQPRTVLPKRLAALRIFGPPMRFAMRVYNYLWKQQRELNAAQTAAAREMIWIVAITSEYVGKLSDTVRGIERFRGESIVELRDRINAIDERLQGLERAHHLTREIAEQGSAAARSVERVGEQMSDLLVRCEAAVARVDHAHERIDAADKLDRAFTDRLDALASVVTLADRRSLDALADVQRLGARAEITPTGTEIRTQIVDAMREVDRRASEVLDRALRSDALLRGDIASIRRSLEPLPGAHQGAILAVNPASEELNPALYELIEDSFRGERSVVVARLHGHCQRIGAAGTVSAAAPLVDVGCGRGELLYVAAAAGLPAIGFDTNEIAVNECAAQGLDATLADGLSALTSRPVGSVGAITAIHVVEHVAIGYAQKLLAAALRALVPGGVLVLETPNPNNLLVATRSFYLDPTHLRPIPPALLALLVEAAGFVDVEIVELSVPESPVFGGVDPISKRLDEFFSGAQDYAVVARAPR